MQAWAETESVQEYIALTTYAPPAAPDTYGKPHMKINSLKTTDNWRTSNSQI